MLFHSQPSKNIVPPCPLRAQPACNLKPPMVCCNCPTGAWVLLWRGRWISNGFFAQCRWVQQLRSCVVEPTASGGAWSCTWALRVQSCLGANGKKKLTCFNPSEWEYFGMTQWNYNGFGVALCSIRILQTIKWGSLKLFFPTKIRRY